MQPKPEPTIGFGRTPKKPAQPAPEPTIGFGRTPKKRAQPTPEPTIGFGRKPKTPTKPTPEPTIGFGRTPRMPAKPKPEPTIGFGRAPKKPQIRKGLDKGKPYVETQTVGTQRQVQQMVSGRQSPIGPSGASRRTIVAGAKQPPAVGAAGGKAPARPATQLELPLKLAQPAPAAKPIQPKVTPKAKPKGKPKFGRRTEPSEEAARAAKQHHYSRVVKREYNKYRQAGGKLSIKDWLKARGNLRKLGNDPDFAAEKLPSHTRPGSKVHPKVPPLDAAGQNVRGVLKVGAEEVGLKPGEKGPGRWLIDNLKGGKGSGLTRAWTHVEGHGAGLMRRFNIRSAELFINKVPCGGASPAMCRFVLQKLMPPGAKLKVHFPDPNTGQTRTWLFEGGADGWRVIQ